MANIVVREPTRQDVEWLAEHMRLCDVHEVLACGSQSPLHAISESVALSDWSQAFVVDDQVICIAGVSTKSIIDRVGVPWALGSDLMGKYPRDVLKHTERLVSRMHQQFDRLENVVHADNLRSIRWLQWAGFTIGQGVEFSNGEQFYHFFWER